ncbi:hypothetical protein RHGRI_004621 [Rhododendron griersonianum]|uniref:Uncharacterized protein n=1 Tax=Rhododendron griersonianum TaxID=479676 RepID=A0AAV6L998_9ERIC|nr:hypothetical protein RHGRI_004621 [Rhododendron griersonianum]
MGLVSVFRGVVSGKGLSIPGFLPDPMETGESILDAIFDEDSLEDVQEVEMMDVEGVLVEQDSQSDLGQNIGRDCRAEKQESCSKSRRRRSKKKNREKKASSGQKVTDINRPSMRYSIFIDVISFLTGAIYPHEVEGVMRICSETNCMRFFVICMFVLDTGRCLQEKETYLMHTAVGCLGISALDDLVKEVNCIPFVREIAHKPPIFAESYL